MQYSRTKWTLAQHKANQRPNTFRAKISLFFSNLINLFPTKKRAKQAYAFYLLLITPLAYANCQDAPLIWGWIDWPPFIYQQENGEMKGIDFNIISQVMAQTSCKIQLSEYPIPWRRQLAWLEVGRIAMMNGASKTAEREKYAYFSIPYRSESVSLYIRKADLNKFSITHLSQLLDANIHSLGFSKGSYYGEEFAKLLNDDNFQQLLHSDFDANNFNRLSNQRLDAVIADSISGAELIKQLGLSDEVVAMPNFNIVTGDIHVMFSKKVVPLSFVEQVNQAIMNYKKSTEYKQLLQLTLQP